MDTNNNTQKYDFNGKVFTMAFPSFKRHRKLQVLLKEGGEESYNDFDKVKEMLALVFNEDVNILTEDDISFGQVGGAVQDFFAKSMEMNKR